MESGESVKFSSSYVAKLIQRGLKESSQTKVSAKDPAVEVCAELLRVFALEACTRASIQAQKEGSPSCEVEHVEKNGYCVDEPHGKNFRADCSVTLIKSVESGFILVDTSGPWNKDKLLKLIENQGVHVNEIKTVVCTHGHSDHVGNLNLFSDACKLIVGHDISVGNVYEEFDFDDQTAYKLASDIEVIPTPGHTHADVSVVVRNTDLGVVVVAGDLFEKEEDLNDEKLWQINSENPEHQKKNREKILQIADHIIPGHGPMFAVKS